MFIDRPEDGYQDPAVATSLTRRTPDCRLCYASGVRSLGDGTAAICDRCGGTGKAVPPRDRMRATWGVR